MYSTSLRLSKLIHYVIDKFEQFVDEYFCIPLTSCFPKSISLLLILIRAARHLFSLMSIRR